MRRLKGFGIAVACLSAAAFLSGCSSDSDGHSSSGSSPAAGGASAADSLRALRGEVIVLGSSIAAPNALRTFTGPPSVTSPGKDEVSCAFAPDGSLSSAGILTGPNLTISAAISGRAQPQAKLVLVLMNGDQPAPLQEHTVYQASLPQQTVQLVARLSHESESSFYEYSYSTDTSVTPAIASSCLVQVTAFSEQHITGQVACKDLSSTSASLDATASSPSAKASGTIAFDCPVQVVDKNGKPVGPGGGAGNAGGGGTSNAGGGAGGASAGSGGSLAGTGGSAAGSGGSAGMGSPPPNMGLGTACSQSSDCASPLSCRYDSQDYIADMQCTLACNDDSTCTNVFGASSFCIGANVCAHRCTSDLDCSAKTHCNSNHWCERGGPGSGVPYCSGFATPCGLLTSLQCIGADGCKDTSACSGIATSCYSLFDSYSCGSQQGCYWSTSGKSCSGSASSCSSNLGQYSCSSQQGCSWSGGCTGTPKSCDAQFPSLCTTQPGCVQKTD